MKSLAEAEERWNKRTHELAQVRTQAAPSRYTLRLTSCRQHGTKAQLRSRQAWDAGASIDAIRVALLTGLHKATVDLREDVMADIRASDVLTFNAESLKLCSGATRILIADFQGKCARRGAGLEKGD